MLAAAVLPAAGPQHDAAEIIRQTVARNDDILEALRGFQYHRYREIRWLDSTGKVRRTDSTLHEVHISHGAPYSQLLAEDGVRLDPAALRREEQKRSRELSRRASRSSSELREFDQEMNERRLVMRQLPEAFHWTLHGEALHSGRSVWILRARPRSGWRPPTSEARILTKVAGDIWIDQQQLRMVKIDAHIEDTFSFAWFLLRIQPGFSFRFEQSFWEGREWLPRHATVKGAARIAGIKTVRLEIDTQYSSYRRHQSPSPVVASASNAAH
ncbi:MAG: hypothetical protein IPJ98_22650 [Bryobacterales bacterium]|nr:hypothetical protein [Bryobacterales bacterium]